MRGAVLSAAPFALRPCRSAERYLGVMPQTREESAAAAAAEAPGRAPAARTLTHRVKVCGITTLEDAQLACELGAWALGMIFYEGSPRRCALAQARVVCAAMRRRAELSGVFVNAPLGQVVATSEELGLTLLQLHGDEGPAFCAEAARRTGTRVIKAVQVAGAGDVRDIERFHVDFHLFDTRPHAGGLRGGTGESFDWRLLAQRRSRVPAILSGGLTVDNVAEGIAAVRPWAVDTASGTERAPGHKDPVRMRAFFDAVAEAGAEPAAGSERS